jgi:hypothetical protein
VGSCEQQARCHVGQWGQGQQHATNVRPEATRIANDLHRSLVECRTELARIAPTRKHQGKERQ